MADDVMFLCWQCVGDPVLRDWLEERGRLGTCSFCNKRRRVSNLAVVAEEVDRVIRQFYYPSPDSPHVVDWSDNVQYWQDGDTAREIISDIAQFEPGVTDALVEMLAQSEWREVRDGADAYYDNDSHLTHVRAYPDEFMSIWIAFEERLKHERRFFDEDGKRMLDELFGDLPDIAGGHSILTIAPGEEFSTLYRARIVDPESDAVEFVRDPASHIGPPPPHLARAGRMNPAGIPAFYGAFAKEVALAEVRPPAGAMVAIGKFALVRPVRLLDMSFLPFAYHHESIFSPSYDRARNKVKFLAAFHRRISRPILPTDEVLAYLPTQAVAAYVANVMGLDGIVYSSIQVGADDTTTGNQVRRALCNVALFGSAATVEPTVPPPLPPDDAPDFDADPIPLWGILGRTPPETRTTDDTGQFKANSAPGGSIAENTAATVDALSSTHTVALPEGQSEVAKRDENTSNEATLRVERDPELVHITAVKVEDSAIFAHLYPDGRVIIDTFDRDDDDD